MRGHSLIALVLLPLSWAVMRLAQHGSSPQSEVSVQYGGLSASTLAKPKPIAATRALIPSAEMLQASPKQRFVNSHPLESVSARRLPLRNKQVSSFEQDVFPLLKLPPQAMVLPINSAPETNVPAPISPVEQVIERPVARNAELKSPLKLDGSFWLLARPVGAKPSLAEGGVLGGSQAGIRFRMPVASIGSNLGIAASLRATSALVDQDKEIAFGVSLKRQGIIPVEAVVERRLSLEDAKRSRWGIFLASGVNDIHIVRGIKFDAYGQAGIVGLKDKLAFVGGSTSLRKSVISRGRLALDTGISAWGDAQPGVSRLDLGPELSLRTSAASVPVRISAQWRIRIAGKAQPGSGPALTIAGDF